MGRSRAPHTSASAGEAPDFHFLAEENKLARNVDFFPRLRNGLQPGTEIGVGGNRSFLQFIR